MVGGWLSISLVGDLSFGSVQGGFAWPVAGWWVDLPYIRSRDIHTSHLPNTGAVPANTLTSILYFIKKTDFPINLLGPFVMLMVPRGKYYRYTIRKLGGWAIERNRTVVRWMG